MLTVTTGDGGSKSVSGGLEKPDSRTSWKIWGRDRLRRTHLTGSTTTATTAPRIAVGLPKKNKATTKEPTG